MLDSLATRKACNIYFLYNSNLEAVLVDPGYNEGNRLIEHINKLNLKVVAILLTHSHYDHITALKDVIEAFQNAVTYISEDELDMLDNPITNLSKFREDGTKGELTYKPKKIVSLTDGEEIELAGFKIKAIKTPFHTKGSMCYYVKSENMLFSGDTLFYSAIGRTDLPTGSARTVESSLSRLLELPLETRVYPGHGIMTTLEREHKYNVYLRNI